MTKPFVPAAAARVLFTPEKLREHFAYDPLTGTMVDKRTGEPITKRDARGYLAIWSHNAILLVHRMAWRMVTGEWPEGMLDHIDGDRANNRWANLRPSNPSHNTQNLHKAMRTNKTGFLGVRIAKGRAANPYRAAIVLHGKTISLGAFKTAEEAYEAYLKGKAIHHPGCGPRAGARFPEAVS